MKSVGRKGAGTHAQLRTALVLFLCTQVETIASVLGFSCAISFLHRFLYGLLHPYTSEPFPAPIYGTANGLVTLFSWTSGLIVQIIAACVGVDLGELVCDYGSGASCHTVRNWGRAAS
jgi:hypothetical protein